MNNTIFIYGIVGCNTCEKVGNALKKANASFVFYNCIDYSNACHYLKRITGAYDYPIVVLQEKNTIIYFSLQYSPTKKVKNLADGFLGIEILTAEEMVDSVLKIISDT